MAGANSFDTIDLSASQVKTFEECKRKWAFGKIDGIYLPGGPAAELGTAVHAVREAYLIEGKPIDIQTREGQIAICGIKDIPLPMTPGLEVEAWFDFYLTKELHFRGRIDYRHLGMRPPVIGDHKTTSDFKWALGVDDLQVDIQANLYTKDARNQTGEPVVDLRWHYMTTGSQPQSRTVRATIGDGLNEDILGRVKETGLVMLKTRREFKRALDVEYDASACWKYGGCPFQGHCNLSNSDRAASIFGNLRDHTLAEQGTLHQTTHQESTMADSGNALLNRLNARKNVDAAATPAGPAVGAPPAGANGVAAVPSAAVQAAAALAGQTSAAPTQPVNPPEAPPPAPSPLLDTVKNVWVPAILNTDTGKWEFPPGNYGPAGAAAGAAAVPAPAEGGGGDLLARAKRGRKPKAPESAGVAPAADPPGVLAAPSGTGPAAAPPHAASASPAAPPSDAIAAARAKAAAAAQAAKDAEAAAEAELAALLAAEEVRVAAEQAAAARTAAAERAVRAPAPAPVNVTTTGVLDIDYDLLAKKTAGYLVGAFLTSLQEFIKEADVVAFVASLNDPNRPR